MGPPRRRTPRVAGLPAAAGRVRRRRGERGYNLVILTMTITIMGILLAAALPLWSQLIKRDKEEELRFRGLQYAEAIRLFQARFGRYPVRLEELIEVKPRSIRRLWKDPMTKSGRWGLVFAGPGGAGNTFAPDATQPQAGKPDEQQGTGQGEEGEPSGPGGSETVTVGPIVGVHSLSDDTSLSSFFGASSYKQWVFRVDIIQFAMKLQGGGGVGPAAPTFTRLEWLGRPFRSFLEQGMPAPPGGQVVGGPPGGAFPGAPGSPGLPGGAGGGGGKPGAGEGGGGRPGGGGGFPGGGGGTGGGTGGGRPGGGFDPTKPQFPGFPQPVPGNQSTSSLLPAPASPTSIDASGASGGTGTSGS